MTLDWTRIERLGPDWDSYGGIPPTGAVLAAAKALGEKLSAAGLTPDRLVPTNEGGIALVYFRAESGFDGDVEVFPDLGVLGHVHSSPEIRDSDFWDVAAVPWPDTVKRLSPRGSSR